MTRILHVTPHLGGGVGTVLRGYLSYSTRSEGLHHSVCCLERANDRARQWAAGERIPLADGLGAASEALLEAISAADVTVLHWWNHPLLFDLLVNLELPAARVILWSHVAGHTAPQVFTSRLVDYPDLFVLATAFSYRVPVLAALPAARREARVRVVHSNGGVGQVAGVRPAPHEGFRVGYVGTVDYCKLHREFVRMSAASEIPGVEFVVCGGDREDEVRREAERLGVAGRFRFLGRVDDVPDRLAGFDVFGYPLDRRHFGTGEQALLEAMAAGVPPVVLSGGAEEQIVEHEVTGLVVDGVEAYPRALERLHRDAALRLRLADETRRRTRRDYAIERTAAAWRALYDEVLAEPKRRRRWRGVPATGPVGGSDLFLESLGEAAADFSASRDGPGTSSTEERIAALPYRHRTPTRGTVFHYRRFFPDDADLNRWCALLG